MTDYHPVVEKIKSLLDGQNVPYTAFEHEAVRTSEEAAALRPEYSLAQGAKALIVRVTPKATAGATERYFVQVVVPGDARFDSKKLKTLLSAKDISFATEADVVRITGGVQPGGVPPFGNLFGLSVHVDTSLLVHETIIFNAGDRRFSIAMKSVDYRTAVQPKVVSVV